MQHFWVAISTLFFICSFDPVYFISPCWLHSVRFSLNGHFDCHTLSYNKTRLSNIRRKYELLPPKTININKQQEVDRQRQWTIEYTAINKSENKKYPSRRKFHLVGFGQKGHVKLTVVFWDLPFFSETISWTIPRRSAVYVALHIYHFRSLISWIT